MPNSLAKTLSPGRGQCGTRATRSVMKLPTTATSNRPIVIAPARTGAQRSRRAVCRQRRCPPGELGEGAEAWHARGVERRRGERVQRSARRTGRKDEPMNGRDERDGREEVWVRVGSATALQAAGCSVV